MRYIFLFLLIATPIYAVNREPEVFNRVTDVCKVYNNTVDSIVEVNLGKKLRGTGIAVRKNVIATAAHVVQSYNPLQIVTNDGKIVDGNVIFNDSDYDLALIKVEIELKPVKLCLKPLIGEIAIAIGHANKQKNTLTTGVISGVNRDMELSDVTLHGLIQTSACLNPGNSGGPLFNVNGELLGINVVTQYNGLGYSVNAKDLMKALTVE